MLTDVCQRWTERVGRWRPAGELIDVNRYDVAPIAKDGPAKDFVLRHHYAGTYPAARFRHGLYRAGELVGVAVFSQPVNNRTLAVLPGEPIESVELGRFVLLDDVPGNGETWFLARCFEDLRRRGLVGVVSFSDPIQRADASGNRVFGGHIGTIYQAHNGIYLGRGTARTLKLLPNGTVLSDRAIQKIRAGEQGWRYSVAQLEAAGAVPFDGGDRRAWLAAQLPRVTRPLRHPGNHKYVWALQRSARKALPASLAYPKLIEPAAALAA
jgi:hypothetical protein